MRLKRRPDVVPDEAAVRVGPVMAARIDVYRHARQLRDAMKQTVAHRFGDLMNAVKAGRGRG